MSLQSRSAVTLLFWIHHITAGSTAGSIICWELSSNGISQSSVAMKPAEENMSEYCRVGAAAAFDELVQSLQTKYIAVTYNNTYKSKSTSSQNKITLEQIRESLNRRGSTQIFEKPYRFFNAGKTEFDDHKELLFITMVWK